MSYILDCMKSVSVACLLPVIVETTCVLYLRTFIIEPFGEAVCSILSEFKYLVYDILR